MRQIWFWFIPYTDAQVTFICGGHSMHSDTKTSYEEKTHAADEDVIT